MKQLISFVLVAVLVCSVSVTAFAAELDEGSKTGSITISYGVAEGYVVTIPADISVSEAGVESVLSASSVLIPDGKMLTVSVTSANGFCLECTGSKIPYTVSVEGAVQSSATFTALAVASGNTEGDARLTFQTSGEHIAKATKSGMHTDSLTFSCSVG